MGAGKTTALAAARAAGLETTEIDDADGSRARAADRRGVRARTARRPSARARRRSSARCWRRPTAARSRSAAAASSPSGSARRSAATSSSGCRSTPTRPGAGSPAPTGRWPATRGGRRDAAGRARCRSTKSWPTRSCRWATAAIDRRALPAIRALAELPPGRSCSGRRAPPASTRSTSAATCSAGLLDSRLGVAGRGAGGRRFCVTDAAVGAALRRAAGAAGGDGRGRSPARRRRRWPRPSGCCASWPAPG